MIDMPLENLRNQHLEVKLKQAISYVFRGPHSVKSWLCIKLKLNPCASPSNFDFSSDLMLILALKL